LVPMSYLIGVYWGFGLPGAWFALIMYTTTYMALMFIKFYKGKWHLLKKI